MQLFRPRLLGVFLLTLLVIASPLTAQNTPSHSTSYLPLLMHGPGQLDQVEFDDYQVNVPYFAVEDVHSKYSELAVFWFGRVNRSENYTDVRVGYNDSELHLQLAVFDRRIWYNNRPTADALTDWDAVTLYLDTEPGTPREAGQYRFVAQFGDPGDETYKAAYQAMASGWSPSVVPFATRPGWRGERLNDDGDDRGWTMLFRIPFTSLGRQSRPDDGTLWRMALVVHDRDDAEEAPNTPTSWPPEADIATPRTWGRLRFGLPSFTPPQTSGAETVTIRHGLDGVTVPDAAVGGGTICGDGLDFWGEWGDSMREAGRRYVNVQNQSDVADWPCYSKYYLSFPLDTLPAGKVVTSAKLVLYQFGNSEPSQASPSLIQVFTVAEGWAESTLSWNNAPLARENVGAGWVDPLTTMPNWPGVPRKLEISAAVARAYADGRPLRLALYSADSDYHSGKYFSSSDVEDWNAVGRPTLVVTLGTPPDNRHNSGEPL